MFEWFRRLIGKAQHEFEEEMKTRAGVLSDDEQRHVLERHEMIERRLRERFADPGTGKFKVQ